MVKIKLKSLPFCFADLTNPKISAVGLPLVSGTNINLSCSIITTLEIKMHWNCLNFTSVQLEQINSTYTATLFMHLRSSYNGRICSCIARFKQITSSATITLNISSKICVEKTIKTVISYAINF